MRILPNVLAGRGLAAVAALSAALLVMAADGSTSAAQQALTQDGAAGFHRRVLSLPDSKIQAQPSHGAEVVEQQVPTFSIFYIYGEKLIDGETWLEVGRQPEGGGIGWMPKTKTEEWKSMLVMQYAPRGQRERVLFFDDKAPLREVVESADPAARAATLRAAGGGTGGVVAMEPPAVVDQAGQPYLMPILDYEFGEFDSGDLTTLVQVGGLNASQPSPAGDGAAAAGGAADGDGAGPDLPAQPDLSEFRTGIVFVIDTTQSMGPYIERTRETVKGIYDRIEAAGNLDKVAFGIVGYRDYVDYNPGIEYVTRVYQDLSPETPPSTLLRNMQTVTPAKVPTQGWSEDAYAGLHTAITSLNWDPFAARVIVLMSDAGMRPSSDPHSAVRNFGGENVIAEATRKGITIFPIHLRTEEAARANNVATAERQMRAISRTGDANVDKYVGIESGTLPEFGRFVDDFARQVESAVSGAANNRMVRRPDLAPPPDGAPPPQQEPQQADDAAPPPETELGAMLVNEVFRAQLEYLGRHAGTQAPSFYRAWAADCDLDTPVFDALDVSVFLNRTQLNGLAQALDKIVARAKAAELNPTGFFDLLQSLSATMEHDPNRSGAAGEFENLAESGLLPDYLEALPYHSKVLRMTRQTWLDWGLTGQQEFILDLEDKLALYARAYQDTDNWIDLGAGDPGLAVYPVPLRYLP